MYIYQNELALAFNIIWLMEIVNVEIEEQFLIKYYMIKHLILLKIENIMDINVDFLQWFINFLIEKLQVEQLKMKLFLIKN